MPLKDGSVIYLKAIGGYDPATEGSEKGSFRALEFVVKLRRADMPAFAKASVDISTSATLPGGAVQLQLAVTH